MELVSNSAEHHFLTTLEGLKSDLSGWSGLYFSLSKMITHEKIIKDLPSIPAKLKAAGDKRDAFLKDLQKALNSDLQGYIYVFSDFDIFVMVKINDKAQKSAVVQAYSSLSEMLPKGFSDMSMLEYALRNYQKLADEKLLCARRFDAYQSMADENKVASISPRRQRRDDPLVMVVEDDRFTLHYTSTILSKEYDLVLAKNGEEAIELYMENAPDIVFLDIHLPGLSGHDVLQAIYAVDPAAFVVMLSVDSIRENITKASQFGAKRFLKKPFSKERMIDMVRTSPYVREIMLSNTDPASSDLLH